jgi:hypothetical protein
MKNEEQEELKKIINNNNYIKKCKSNKNKDISSLSYSIIKLKFYFAITQFALLTFI